MNEIINVTLCYPVNGIEIESRFKVTTQTYKQIIEQEKNRIIERTGLTYADIVEKRGLF